VQEHLISMVDVVKFDTNLIHGDVLESNAHNKKNL
jgi:hypothetical protein